MNSEYGLLFSDPPREEAPGQKIGRIATSVIAVACLRAQTGVGPQVTSHIFGLRKALDDGSWKDDIQNEERARLDICTDTVEAIGSKCLLHCLIFDAMVVLLKNKAFRNRHLIQRCFPLSLRFEGEH